jgi:hypothetical protein
MIQSGQCSNSLLLPFLTTRQYAVKQYSLYPDYESSFHGCSPQYERTGAEVPLIYLLTYSLRHRRVVKHLVAKGCQHLSPKQTHEGSNTEFSQE